MSTPPTLLLDASWPTVHPILLALLGAALTFLATWFWKIRDERRAAEKAESQALADLKQKQQSDILKIEGTIALLVNTLDRLTGTAEQVTTITERVAGNTTRLNDFRTELSALRDAVQPQLAELKEAVRHLRDH